MGRWAVRQTTGCTRVRRAARDGTCRGDERSMQPEPTTPCAAAKGRANVRAVQAGEAEWNPPKPSAGLLASPDPQRRCSEPRADTREPRCTSPARIPRPREGLGDRARAAPRGGHAACQNQPEQNTAKFAVFTFDLSASREHSQKRQ